MYQLIVEIGVLNMPTNAQSRKWHLVFNNPQDCGLTQEAITEIAKQFFPDYFCMADEISETGTPHTHLFIISSSPIRFTTLKNRFPTAHIEKANGSAMDNKGYITKSGKWALSEKAETSIEGSFYEWGNIPTEKEEKSPKMFQLIESIKAGMSVMDIINDNPALAFRIKDIEILRQTILAEKYASENRKLEVSYVHGASGTGKTSGIFEKHGVRDVCRITNYRKGQGVFFDGYSGQDVLVFEEYNSQIQIEEMLNYLDIYPLNLPARYSDKVACFTAVYITSNIPLKSQYIEVQSNRPETWRALLRRIHKVMEYTADGTVIENSMEVDRYAKTR